MLDNKYKNKGEKRRHDNGQIKQLKDEKGEHAWNNYDRPRYMSYKDI